MKRHNAIFISLFASSLYIACFGQIKSIGFTQKVPRLLSVMQNVYYPKMHLINDTLYVCSSKGIYQKDMLTNSDWELYAFDDIPVIEFVKNGNKILANALSATEGKDSLIFLSLDGGKTHKSYVSPALLKEAGKNHLYRIIQNPKNLNSILTATVYGGLYESKDFGKNWSNLLPISLGIDIAFTSYHPLDTTTIFFSGENDIFSGRIYRSSDNGGTWIEYIVPGGDNCVHQIAFHPSNPDVLVWGGERKLGKSIDKGETWNVMDINDTGGMYFYKVLFDENDPNILYASGVPARYGINEQDTIWVYRSTDMGDTWHLAYKEYLGANGGGVIDMVKYKDKLIFYTRELGILELDVKTTPVLPTDIGRIAKPELSVYPNPVINTLYFDTDLPVSGVELINSTGSMVQKDVIREKENAIDVSALDTGIYLAVFRMENGNITKKVCIRR